MIEFRYTTGFHGLIQYFHWMLNIATLLLLGYALYLMFPPTFSNSTFGGIFILLVSISVVVILNISLKNFPDNLGSYLYVRLHLKTKMSFDEVKEIAFLFEADLNGKWYPLETIRDYPKDLRKRTIQNFASTLKGKPINSQTKSSDDYAYEQYWKEKESSSSSSTYQDTREGKKSCHSADYYQYIGILNLKEDVTFEEIKAAYLKEIKKYHPDQFEHLDKHFRNTAEEKTKEINRAFEYFKKEFNK